MTPGIIAGIADIPVSAYFGGQIGGGDVFVGEINPIDRQLGHIPRVDVGAEIAGLPAERAGPILDEWSCNGGRYWSAGGASVASG